MEPKMELINSQEISNLGIMHLKRYWQICQLKKTTILAADAYVEEWNTDITMLAALGLGLEQTLKFVYNNNTDFEAFENWILTVNNHTLNLEKIELFNSSLLPNVATNIHEIENALTKNDLEFWNTNGYIIINDAISKIDAQNTVAIICNFLNINEHDANTWYKPNENKQGIMVQLFQDEQLEKNRQAVKIKKAYEQLWQRQDIWVNTDRVGFNPPETDSWKFPGPKLHWDVSLAQPIPFGLQGILYLTDTEANQGAFSLVPGFQNNISNWLNNLPANANPRTENLYALGVKGIAADAGDFIIWHHALPHGSSINTSTKPRFVQYINYAPIDAEVKEKWI